ncbi:uncharacterized protein LOC122340939, partial [Puntigrus tetrazona]|uniref:uncharacterized protein LOC122340939 n=1 Tax=Puntigrus tetrazona TaxID=1606681 RepID=UPI001C8944C0
MRQFMQQQQRNERILFDELHHLKTTILTKPRGEWGFDEQNSQQTHHHSLPSPRTFLPSLGAVASPALSAAPAQPMPGLQATSQVPHPPFRRYHEPRIPEFVEGEDVESFFVRFERIARTWGWPTDEWAARVVTLLTGKALEAYAGMDEQRAGNYEDIKAAVLAKYNVTEETYRLRFRGLTIPSGESVRETYTRIKGLYKRWMRPETKTKDQIAETIILEQYLRMLRPDVRVWVKENQPQTGEEAARLAERYIAAHREPPPRTNKVTVGRGKLEETSDSTAVLGGRKPPVAAGSLICFYCQQPGHKASFCPLRKSKVTSLCYVPRNDLSGELLTQPEKHRHVIPVTVNGQSAQALVDTGSTQTLVKPHLLRGIMMNFGETICLGCVHGEEKVYPTADATIVVDDQAYLLRVGVVEKLAYDVVLGEDFPLLLDLINVSSKPCAVVTRSQSKGLQPLPEAHPDLFGSGGKVKKSKRVRRQEKHRGKSKSLENIPDFPGPGPDLIEPQWQVPDSFRELQKSDDTLQSLFKKICEIDGKEVGAPKLGGDRYILKDNLLQVRGPLDMLKEGWTTADPAQCSVASYILQMRDKLEKFRQEAQENLQMAQKKQKVWYDKHAREKDLSPGEKVLVLLPSGTCKLLAKWQGPYVVNRRLGPVTYEILCPERKHPKQILHANLLRKFKERLPESEKQVTMLVRAVDDEVDEVEMEPIRPSEENPALYAHLSNLEQQQLMKVCQSFPTLFQERPGLTAAITHNIILKDPTPVRQKPYRVPEKMVEKLKTEVKMMLEMGIIEPSQSEWSSPILLVPKKDGGVRFCTDFRKLNSVSCFDSYPMPRIDELIERLDLTKKSPSKFHWTRECEEAFVALKDLICQDPILQSPDFSKRFLVQVDASDVGLGAVLAQGETG